MWQLWGVEFDSSAYVQSGMVARLMRFCSFVAGRAKHAMSVVYRAVCGVQAGMSHTMKSFMGAEG